MGLKNCGKEIDEQIMSKYFAHPLLNHPSGVPHKQSK